MVLAFTPRLVEPSATNPWYIHVSKGGKNSCILIEDNSVLPNCFTWNTPIITKTGVWSIGSLVWQEVEIPTIDGNWHTATIKYFGKQQVWRVFLSNGNVYRCSGNHRWLIYDHIGLKPKYTFVDTSDLRPGMKIHYYNNLDSTTVLVIIPTDDFEDMYCAVEPVTHTMTLGGGELTGNCVGYAWGRFGEILGSVPSTLPRNDAQLWWTTPCEYEKGNTPKLGSVIVWAGGGAGHVAIVEEIHSDGSIEVSESYFNGNRFHHGTVYPPSYDTPGYKCLGFIYNPGVNNNNPTDDFINEAIAHIGENNEWTRKITGIGENVPWSLPFIIAVAHKVGKLLNSVLPQVYSISKFINLSVSKYNASFQEGSYFLHYPSPQVGDLICFRYKPKSDLITEKYYSDAIGIVIEVRYDSVIVVSGNNSTTSSSLVTKFSVSMSDNTIVGYLRPKWENVGGISSTQIAINNDVEPFNRQDAKVREIGFWSPSGITLEPTDVRISSINFSDVNYFISNINAENKPQNTINVSTLTPPKLSNVATFLAEKGFQPQQIAGMLGGICVVSGFTVGLINNRTGGICAWQDVRFEKLKKLVPNWLDNLSGQYEYMYYELSTNYASTLDKIKSVETTNESSAVTCAKYFFDEYLGNNNAMFWDRVVARTEKIFSQIVEVNTMPIPIGNDKLLTRSGKQLSSGKRIMLPNDLNQSGLTTNNTNYSYFYPIWASSTRQRIIADIWSSQGRPSDRNIATVSNYYLVAVSPIIGTVGDVLTIILEDNTSFNALVADAKGLDATNPWGHTFGNGQVDVIEWEKKGSVFSAADNIEIDLTGWRYKTVSTIINYGTYLD